MSSTQGRVGPIVVMVRWHNLVFVYRPGIGRYYEISQVSLRNADPGTLLDLPEC